LTIADVFWYARLCAERWEKLANGSSLSIRLEDTTIERTAIGKGHTTMSFMDMGNNPAYPDESKQDELKELLLQSISSQEPLITDKAASHVSGSPRIPYPGLDHSEEDEEVSMNSDVQGGLGLYAEASQDLATAGVELALGRHFACVDYCNQAVEKAAQAVSLLRKGHRTMYDHDLRALGVALGAPTEVQEDMETLTPFHPEAFYAETPPEEADEVINAEQANEYIQTARRVLRWARGIIL
jgi:HEPN domain-containing protein